MRWSMWPKEFDSAFEAGLSSQRANRFKVRPSTLRRVAKLEAGLAVTFYREDRAEDGAANLSRSIRAETNRTSSTAGSRGLPHRWT